MSTESERQAAVLIVDDNPANLGVLSDFLDEAGFEVWVAQSGQVALERVQYALPELILLDVMMPEVDGFETCRLLKENPATKEIPVIFMTALSDSIHKVKGLSLGAVDYITKPFQQDEVLARVQLHLKLYSLTQQLAEQNLLLEQRVEERTAEVKRGLQELQQAQIQLVQSEKMSSLGQLVAGVAHEINNPVNFICGNLVHADEYIQQVLEVLQLYQGRYPDPGKEIIDKIEGFDLNFIVEDLPNLMRSMKVGAERIQEIVRSLRNFSRMDEAKLKAVDIHTGLDSTLMILQNQIKGRPDRPVIEVIKEYGQLPMVECYPGQLNQVFMNILCNAIDAIEESLISCPFPLVAHSEERRKEKIQIRVRTEVLNDNLVTINISDNGSGMTEEVRSKLFNPFFTTKPIGKGTGMGLAISHSIVVEKHKGKLYCLSQVGQGTEFIIQIPVQQTVPQTSSVKLPDQQKVTR